MIVLNTVIFPIQSIEKMSFIRNVYYPGMNIPIDIPTLESMKEFMNRFPSVNRKVFLPRIHNIEDMIDDEIYKWIVSINREDMISLLYATKYLGYDELYEIVCMILSEDFYMPMK